MLLLIVPSTRALGITALVVLVLVGLFPPLDAGAEPPAGSATVRVASGLGGVPLDGGPDTEEAVVSTDGRFVAFASIATNLVPGDTNGVADVFVTDRLFGTTTRASVADDGSQADGPSTEPSISDSGDHIAFTSGATNLVADDTNNTDDVFRYNRVQGKIERSSVRTDGQQVTVHVSSPDISGNGVHVAMATHGDLDPTDANSLQDIYVRNHTTDSTLLASLTSTGGASDGQSVLPSINYSGTAVAFQSSATDLVPGDTSGEEDVFVADLVADTLVRASVGPAGGELSVAARSPELASHADVVVYESEKPAGGDGIRIRELDEPGSTGVLTGSASAFRPSISRDGDRILYDSTTDEGCGGRIPTLFDQPSGATVLPFDVPDGGLCQSGFSSLSGDGRYAVDTTATVLTPGEPGDTANEADVYLAILADTVFPDVPPTHLFFEPVTWMVDAGIATGYDDGTYRPTTVISRQAMAAFLYRMLSGPRGRVEEPTFTDVPEDHPFHEEIMWAAEQGLVEGFDDGTFRPTEPVSRQAMVALLYRATVTDRAGSRDATFTDVPEDHGFFDEIEWAAAEAVVQGYDDGTFRPSDPISRQAAAAFVHRWQWGWRTAAVPV